jgi:heat shock protein HslJ
LTDVSILTPTNRRTKVKSLKGFGWIIALILSMGYFACDTATLPDDQVDIQGNWELVALGSTTVNDPGRYTVRFNADDTINVQADCNLCNGGYEASGNNLSIGNLACTRAACPPDSLFDEYVAALSSATSYRRSGNQLLIDSGTGAMAFRVSQ